MGPHHVGSRLDRNLTDVPTDEARCPGDKESAATEGVKILAKV
jgi:hypothetical protein